MKRIVLLLVAVLAMLSASAQRKTGFEFRFGLGSSTYAGGKHHGHKLAYKVGLGYDYAIDRTLSLQPALMFVSQGCWDDVADHHINAYYAEVPLLVCAKMPVSKTVKGYMNIGPSFAVGLGGNAFDDDYYFGLRHFDVGIEGGVGLEFTNGLKFGLELNRGFVHLHKKHKWHNFNVFGIIAYKF